MAATKKITVRHQFGGGWATDFGPAVDVSPNEEGKVIIPFLTEAENVLFELDGGPHKVGGTTRVNSSALESGANVMGVYDYWKQGVSGAPSRRRICHVGAKVLADNDDGNFATELSTGFEIGKIPSYATFDDILIYSSDSTTDVPRSWDQSTAQNLAGSPPNFAFSAEHRNRLWAAGDALKPSRLYYSANVDPEDWIGAGSGSIDISPDDGDIITGIVSHKNELWVFKGPNKGSIHRITGSAPTGGDGFARTTFVKGIGAAWHNTIFHFSNDIGFVSQFGSVHSLAATANFGDFSEAALSRPINIEIRERLNYNKLREIQAATDQLRGVVYITAAWDGSLNNNNVLAMDYRSAPDLIRWSRIPAYEFASISTFVDTNGVRRVLGGDNAGFVRRLNIVDRSLDTVTAITAKVTTPHLNYGLPILEKTLEQGSVGIQPKGSFDFTFGWVRDDNAQQTLVLSQGGGDVLAPATSNVFTLGTSLLSGARFFDVFHEFGEEGGNFRSVAYEFLQSGLNQDFELHSFTVSVTPSGDSTEN